MNKEDIIDKIKSKIGITKKKLLRSFPNEKQLNKILDELKRDKVIHEVGKKYQRYFFIIRGNIDLNPKGFAFIRVGEDSYFVPRGKQGHAFAEDTVMAISIPPLGYKDEKLDNVEVIGIEEHNITELVCRLILKETSKGKKYLAKVKYKNAMIEVIINRRSVKNALPGDIVMIAITKYLGAFKCIGYVTKILAKSDEKNLDITEIAAKFGFVREFDGNVQKETDAISNVIEVKDFPNRNDLTNEMTITIDGADSRDFDDAVSITKLPNGNYKLGVYIADVSHYVRVGSALDEEAYQRGTSVYLADRVIPMLPFKISNDVCSLNEGVNRLCTAAIMEINKKGDLVNTEICEGVIKSNHRMTYGDVNEILVNENEELCSKYTDVLPMLNDMQELSDIIRAKRKHLGGLEFDTPEYKFVIDKNGFPIDIVRRGRNQSEMIIEDMMVQANEAVAKYMINKKIPSVYRVHENPKEDRLHEVFDIVRKFDKTIEKPGLEITQKDIQSALKTVSGTANYGVINTMFLRSMAKARYSDECLGHYGLALKYYCHFTSPIRRYPDLMVHRMLKEYIFKTETKPLDNNKDISGIADDCSIQERKAVETEREVNDMLMAKFMSRHVKERYVGTISSVTGFGFFVMLDNGIEGLVHISTLNGRYTFDNTNFSLDLEKGRYKNLTNDALQYRIGDTVDIIVVGANTETHKVDFMTIADYDNLYGADKHGNNFKK